MIGAEHLGGVRRRCCSTARPEDNSSLPWECYQALVLGHVACGLALRQYRSNGVILTEPGAVSQSSLWLAGRAGSEDKAHHPAASSDCKSEPAQS